jgi:hypothetical protein
MPFATIGVFNVSYSIFATIMALCGKIQKKINVEESEI